MSELGALIPPSWVPAVGVMCVVGRHDECEFDLCGCVEKRIEKNNRRCHAADPLAGIPMPFDMFMRIQSAQRADNA